MTSLSNYPKVNGELQTVPFNVSAVIERQGKTQTVSSIVCNKATITNLVATNAAMKTSPDSTSNDNTIATTSFVHDLLDAFTPSTGTGGGDGARTGIVFDELTGVSSATNLTTSGYVSVGQNLVVQGTVEFATNAISRASVNGLNTMLAQRAMDGEVVHLTGNETLSGTKSFTNSPLVPTPAPSSNNTKVATCAYVDVAISNLINGAPSTMDTLNEIANVLQTNTDGIASITNNMVNLTTTQTVQGTKTIPILHSTTQAINDNSTSVATTAFVKAGLDTRQPLGDYVTYSAPTQAVSVASINELINPVSFSSGTLVLDYPLSKGINYVASPTANFAINIINVPTIANTVVNLVLVMSSKFFANAISVNGVTTTPRGSNGFTNSAISASAVYVMQQINICFFDSTTPTVFSNVSSIF